MNYIKRLILICEHCGEKMFDEINVNYEGDLLLIKVGTCACSSMAEFVKANTELAKLTANLIEFLTEVSYKPYNDSDALSLLESLRTRASVILQDIGKDEPFTLTDLPRPWSTDEMKSRPTPLTMDGATVAEFCECGISIESHTGVYCIFRPASNVPGICQCGYMAKYPICTKCGRTYPPKKDSL